MQRCAHGFDRLAPWWDLLATGLSAGAIPRSQTRFLDRVTRGERALVLGGGDGRFVVDLLQAGFAGTVVALDPSIGMLERTMRRVVAMGPDAVGRVDARRGTTDELGDDERFDVVCTHFVLDLFTAPTLRRVMSRLDRALDAGGSWLCADFAPPSGGVFRRGLQHSLLGTLYAAFGAACAVEPRRLPPIEATFARLGYRVEVEARPVGGLLRTTLYRRRPDRP